MIICSFLLLKYQSVHRHHPPASDKFKLVLCAGSGSRKTMGSYGLQAPTSPQLHLLFSLGTMRQETSAGLRSNRHNLDHFHYPQQQQNSLYIPTKLTSDCPAGPNYYMCDGSYIHTTICIYVLKQFHIRCIK